VSLTPRPAGTIAWFLPAQHSTRPFSMLQRGASVYPTALAKLTALRLL
jgi:hypothetical protein